LSALGELGLRRDTSWGGVESKRGRGEGGRRSEERGSKGEGKGKGGRS